MKSRICNPFRSGISSINTILTLGCLAATSASAATRTWDGGAPTNGQWNIDAWANWDGVNIAIASGDDLVFGTTNTNGWTLTSLGGDRTIKSLTFQAGSPAYDIRLKSAPTGTSTDRNLIFNNASPAITVEPGDTSSHTIGLAGGTVTLQGNLTVTHNGSGTLTIDRPITGAGFGVTKEGNGTMKFLGANTYIGATQVNGGILTIGNLAAKGSTSGITAGASGTVGLGVDNSGSTTHYLAADVATLFNRLSADPALTGNLAGYSLNDASRVAVDTTVASAFVDQGSGNALTAPNRSLIKVGTGTYRLNATNTYTGPTIIKQGTLSLGAGLNGGSLSLSSAITVESGATFAVSKNSAVSQGVTFSAAPITGAGSFSHTGGGNGTGVTTLNAANSYAGNTTISAGTLKLGANEVIPHGIDIGNVLVDGTLDLNGKNETINGLSGSGSGIIDNANAAASTLTAGANNQTSTFSGVIQDTAGTLNLIKTGNGTLTLGGANTFSGSVSITEGALALGNTTPIDSASGITMSGGTMLRSQVTGTKILATTPITIGAAATTSTITAPLLPGNSTGASTPKTFEVLGAISGDGDLTLLGVNPYNQYGTIILSAQSIYTGSTLLTCSDEFTPGGNEGNQNIFVRLAIPDALPATTVLTLDGGDGAPLASAPGRYCELNLNGNNQTLAGLTNVPGRTLRVQRVVNNSATTATLTVNNGVDYIYSGQLGWVSGAGSAAYNNFGLTKSGAGIFTLSGANTYTGNTTVSAGTLMVNGNQSAATGNVTVAANATLGGNGTLGGATTVSGNLAPGTSIGQITFTGGLTTGNLNDSSLKFELGANTTAGTTYDTVVTNSLDIGTTLDFPDFQFTGTPAAGTYTLISSGNTTGTLGGNLTGTLGGNLTGTLSKPANDIILTVTGGSTTPYDTWALTKGLDGTAGKDPAKTADPDKDGRNNLQEFALDGNPLSGANDGKVVGKVASVGGSQVMTLTLPVRGTAPTPLFSDSSGDELSALIDGIYYRIEGDVNLSTFADDITEVTGPDAAAIQAGLPGLSATPPNGWSYRTFRATPGTVPTVPKAFLRAKISETNP